MASLKLAVRNVIAAIQASFVIGVFAIERAQKDSKWITQTILAFHSNLIHTTILIQNHS